MGLERLFWNQGGYFVRTENGETVNPEPVLRPEKITLYGDEIKDEEGLRGALRIRLKEELTYSELRASQKIEKINAYCRGEIESKKEGVAEGVVQFYII